MTDALRKGAVLKLIVSEYIAKAVPVASEIIARNYKLGVSPATIRNDMARLEEEGYINRPHASAGGIPTDKGYRYYVESMTEDIEPPLAEQQLVDSLFRAVDREFEECVKLAAKLLARLVRNIAVVTPPKAARCRFKHLELIAVHEFLILMVLVLSEAKLKQQFLYFSESATQEELTAIASRLNATCAGLTSSEILAQKPRLSPKGEQVAEAVANVMMAESKLEYDEPCFEGLRLMLSQPEFIRGDRLLGIMEMMEGKSWLESVLCRLSEGRVKVIIGEESQGVMLRDLSLVFSQYGIPNEIGGAVGVIGPTRMDYVRVVPMVRYLSGALSNLVTRIHSGS